MESRSFDWDDSQANENVPLRDLSLMTNENNVQPPVAHTTAADVVAQWFNGKVPLNPINRFHTRQDEHLQYKSDPDPTEQFGVSATSGIDDKSYVWQYQQEVQEAIDKISSGSFNLGQNQNPVRWPPRNNQVPHSYLSMVAGTVVTPTNTVEQDSVYQSFSMNTHNKDSQSLAVFKYKDQILKGLNSRQVMIVEGFTGSGKTTQIPQYILDELARESKRGNIVVTQPRRIAAQSVAERVCKERSWNLGDLVGYQVGLNRKTSENTRLTYMTTGVLLQTLISKKTLCDYTHIIVDEVHERDLDTDLLILVIKKLMIETGDKQTRIILMSATLNAEKFADYFPKWKMGNVPQESIIIRIPQSTFHKVYEFYIDGLHRPFGPDFSYQNSSAASDVGEEPKLQSSMYEITVKMLEKLDQFEKDKYVAPLQNKYMTTSHNPPRGGVLAFLPGLMEIDTLYKKCVEYMQQKSIENKGVSLNWTVLPLHSTITTEEQQKVFHPAKPGYRKIILATNIAESSITVTDISYVIDYCLTKSISCDPQTNYSCLRMEWASQDQCVQRRGRVGRVSEGYVFRMISDKFYRQLGKETVPDMEKACLENVILSVKTLDLGQPKAIMALAIDPPMLSAIKLAICNLKEVGALTVDVDGIYTAYDGDLTVMGILMSKLPFDIRLSRLIALGHIFGVLEEAVIIASGLSVKSAFSFPFTHRLMAYLSKLMWSNETFSDCFAIINVYRTWLTKTSKNEFRDYGAMKNWKNAYFVQTNVLREMNLCIQDIIRRLRNIGIDVNAARLVKNCEMTAEQGLMLKIVMAGAFYPNYFVRYRPDANDYARQITRELNSSDPLMTLVYNGFPQEQPGDLYAKHIAQRYETYNSVPYVKVNGSKVLVQFDRRGDKVGPLSMNLFRGVKMRQLRNQVQFRALRSDLSHTICEDEMCHVLSHIKFPCPKLCELPGITEKYIHVSVTKVISPDCFWVMYFNDLPRFNELLERLNYYADFCPPMNKEDIVPGSLCIVAFEEGAYRARIEYINSEELVMLFLVDVGETMWKEPVDCLSFSEKLINFEDHLLPCFAVQCRISGIKPLARYSGAWSEGVSLVMAEQFSRNNNVVLMQIYSIVEGVIACDIYGSGEIGQRRDKGLRDILLERNLAVELEEPKPNRDNENLRRNVTLMKFKKTEIDRHNLAQRKDDTPPIILSPPEFSSCTNEYTLKGPFSPLEMSFRALSASAHTKAVTIEGSSVNSVALDQDPTSPTARLLIAQAVGISQRSGSVIARETTLMPPIPGIAPLMTMLFCPMIQLRSESKSNRFTGCLSGLGMDHATNTAVYPDHDMEAVFDVHFDRKDIELINGIRTSMNMVLNGKDVENLNMADLQNSVRNEIRQLLERPRPSVEEIYPKQEFMWKIPKRPIRVRQDRNGVKRLGFHFRRNDVFPSHPLEPLLKENLNG